MFSGEVIAANTNQRFGFFNRTKTINRVGPDVDISEKSAGHDLVTVTMTLTSPTCGMGQVLANDVRYRLNKVPNVDEVDVKLVFDPPWSRDKISEEAQLELGIF